MMSHQLMRLAFSPEKDLKATPFRRPSESTTHIPQSAPQIPLYILRYGTWHTLLRWHAWTQPGVPNVPSRALPRGQPLVATRPRTSAARLPIGQSVADSMDLLDELCCLWI